ncbi:hypothetical protein TRFO_13431 [Tritrichomonas foetus]|uniref:Uncharacterized protein n=1 Tax=Tritrichomonas foetus TaxID=1144522 RepID=A0A1J4KY01_9EUKA|nr:hypothetical protein TRFO_13431 [Tritrichomonas foetus]|eukprot:OHT16111.1 hypothetical protein TRFO_13431 [Tritrichomonas foetus]
MSLEFSPTPSSRQSSSRQLASPLRGGGTNIPAIPTFGAISNLPIPNPTPSKNSDDSNNNNAQNSPQKNQSNIPSPPIPRLNFSNMSRSCQSLNLSRAQKPPMNIVPDLSLNLDRVEKASSSAILRQVYICVPWKININQNNTNNNSNKLYNQNNENNNEILDKFISQAFGSQKVHSNSEVVNGSIIIEEDENEQNQILSLQMIDTAYQKVDHTPALIEQTNFEYIHLMGYIEQILADIEKLRAEKEKLKISNEVKKAKIIHAKAETKEFSERAINLKLKLDKFHQRNPRK